MSADNALIQALLSQILPEWSISRQEYQPTDIANQTSATNILQDQFQLMAEPLMQILNGTFDYSLLDDVEGEETAAPDTPMLNSYAGNQKYAVMIDALSNGESPEEAARGAWAAAEGKTGDDVWGTTAAQNPSLGNYISVANSLQPEVASVRSWQNSTGGMQKSEMAQTLESMGLSSEQTPDSYFSDSIDQKLAAEEKGLRESKAVIDDYLAERDKFGGDRSNPHLAGLGEAGPSQTKIQDSLPAPKPVNDGSLEAQVEASRGGPSIADVSSAVSDPWLKKVVKPWTDFFGAEGLIGGDEDEGGTRFADNGKAGHDAVMAALRKRSGMGTTEVGGVQGGGSKPGKYFGGGDPRDPRSQTAQAMKWDEDQKKYQNRSLSDVKKYVDARQGAVHGNSSAIERGLIARERSSGRTMQRDALTKLLLSMPR